MIRNSKFTFCVILILLAGLVFGSSYNSAKSKFTQKMKSAESNIEKADALKVFKDADDYKAVSYILKLCKKYNFVEFHNAASEVLAGYKIEKTLKEFEKVLKKERDATIKLLLANAVIQSSHSKTSNFICLILDDHKNPAGQLIVIEHLI